MRRVALGEHLLASRQYDDAFTVLRKTGIAAQEDGRNRLAERALSMAVEAGRKVSATRLEELAETVRDHGRVLIQLGKLERAEMALREGSMLASSAGAPRACSDILRLHGRAVLLLGNTQRGCAEIQSALEIATRDGDTSVASQACLDLYDAAEKTGDETLTELALDRGLRLINSAGAKDLGTVWIQLFNRLGKRELAKDAPSRAIALFARALDLAEQHNDRYQAAGLLGNLGGAYARLKDLAKAIHYLERALRASEELGDQIGIARQSYNLALIRLTTGQELDARQLLRYSHEAASRAGWQEGVTMCKAAMAKLGRP
jgi:tetratricopeptide (TPR) repeat protein